MKIEQFEDKGLAHYAYAILSENIGEIILIDPARNPQPYYDFAAANNAKITGVIETHPHADFVSSHLEIHQKTGATIFVHSLLGADYPHKAFDDGDVLELGEIKLRALHTPGHSPDSISIVLEHEGKDKVVFTGDTLFIGDVGRPDLRESVGNNTAKREELARQMYKSTREKLMKLADDVVVYPTHGAGSLCGKGLSNANSSTIGAEKMTNYALQNMTEDAFVKALTEDQPFIPKYFGYDVNLNKQGAPAYTSGIDAINKLGPDFHPEDNDIVVDVRHEKEFKKGHYKGALNIQNGGKFETWLGSIVGPDEKFYLAAESEAQLNDVICKAAKIGYEQLVKGAMIINGNATASSPVIDVNEFRQNKEKYTILDIRNNAELKSGKIFENALHIPLPELRERVMEVPTDKPVIVHCAAGYRSAAGSSILEAAIPELKVLDLGEAINEFK